MANNNKITPKVKDILHLLSTGALICSLFAFPGAAVGIKAIFDFYEKFQKADDYKKINKYNYSRLRQILKRLQEQKMVSIKDYEGYSIIKLTEKGKIRSMRYNLDDISIKKPEEWDGKWRLIIYDISQYKRYYQDLFRKFLLKLDLLPLQKSVYLTPYPCKDEIEFLRQYLNIGDGVLYLTVDEIENDYIYRKYFKI